MLHLAALVCTAVLTAPPALPADLEAFHEAEAKVGRDAGAHVKLALWCEAHGLQAERLKHLAIAVLTDPANATARGLMGLVAYHGKWQRPDAVAEKVKSDEQLAAALAEYNSRRDRTANTADAQWKLAMWCEEKGLKAEAIAHLSAVVRLDPAREVAWKRLGYKRHEGRWMSDDQIAAEKAETDHQHLANRIWKSKLEKWRTWLTEKGPHHGQAEKGLADVTDPRAVPAVWVVFANGETDQQVIAVQLFGQIDSPAASHALVYLATVSNSRDVRRRAAETLTRRDPRDVVELLISFFRDPVTYEVKPVDGPGSTGVLLVEGKKFNVRRRYTLPALPAEMMRLLNDPSLLNLRMGRAAVLAERIDPSFGPGFGPLAAQIAANPAAAAALVGETRGNPANSPREVRFGNGVMVTSGGTPPPNPQAIQAESRFERNLAEAQRATLAAQQQMIDDINQIETFNQNARETNGSVEAILKNVTGQDIGQDAELWQKWWTEEQGYGYVDPSQPTYKTTFDQQVPLNYSPQFSTAVRRDCFGAGTLVQTREGARAIETIRTGDVVLSQDTRTGKLGFEPVLVVYHDKPCSMLKIDLGGESVVTTGIHRFWKPGKGWAMARDLKLGDSVRTLGGVARVVAVETAPVQPTFNLEVAGGRDFFVGTAGVLVHDKSPVRPELQPFDAEPALAAILPHRAD